MTERNLAKKIEENMIYKLIKLHLMTQERPRGQLLTTFLGSKDQLSHQNRFPLW
jgi:hypothetical protein